MSQNATAGRVVHYAMPDGSPRAAMVVRLASDTIEGAHEDACTLHVYFDGSDDLGQDACNPNAYRRVSVIYDETGAPGTWRWPPRAAPPTPAPTPAA